MIRCFVTVLSLLPAIVAGAAGPAFWDSPEMVPFTDGELRGDTVVATVKEALVKA